MDLSTFYCKASLIVAHHSNNIMNRLLLLEGAFNRMDYYERVELI